MLDIRAIEDAVRVLPDEHRDLANQVLREALYPARGAAFVAIAKDRSDDNVREHVRRLSSARDEALRQLDNIGLLGFVRRARVVLEHPVDATWRRLGRAISVLGAGLQNERFSPDKPSAVPRRPRDGFLGAQSGHDRKRVVGEVLDSYRRAERHRRGARLHRGSVAEADVCVLW